MRIEGYLRRFEVAKDSNLTSRRQSLVKDFVDAINLERKGTKFRQVTGRGIAMKLAHLSTEDIEFFLSECRDYAKRNGSFGKRFFGSLKLK